MKKHVIVRADAFAGMGAAAANASLEEYLMRAMMCFQALIGAAGFLELGGDVTAHAEQLVTDEFAFHCFRTARIMASSQALDTWSLGVKFAASRI